LKETINSIFIFTGINFFTLVLHFPGASIMKIRNNLRTASLIVFLSLLLAGCKSQESITNSVETEPSVKVESNPTTTEKPDQSQFMPFVGSDDLPDDSQYASNPNSVAPYPGPEEASGEPPTPTLFWPTPDNSSFATPYVRPEDAQGQDLPPERWQEWPVIPILSDRALEIYQAGIAQGNNPRHFSKVGDCQNIHAYFLGTFDKPDKYRLGETYQYLQETIDYYAGSWVRDSEAVRTGFNVASVLAPLYANPKNCQLVETPLACEIRIWNPSFVIISMETWTPERPVQVYENYLRQIVEYAISKNVLPIVATKADNLEGNHDINQIVARVAADYDIPMWNFWAAVQPLTDHGLLEDGFHLTNGSNHFDNTISLDKAWPVRNLTALLTIDTVMKTVR
jgi:hypothetical protein